MRHKSRNSHRQKERINVDTYVGICKRCEEEGDCIDGICSNCADDLLDKAKELTEPEQPENDNGKPVLGE
jgi:hypothetical protein